METKRKIMLENELLDIQFERFHAMQNRNLAWIDLMHYIADAKVNAKYEKSLRMELDFWDVKTVELESKAMAIAEQLGGV